MRDPKITCCNKEFQSLLCECSECGNFNHVVCIGLDENRFRNMSKKYYCLQCQEKGFLPIWAAKCRLEWCTRAAIESMQFRYCSKDHQSQFLGENADKVKGVTRQQLGSIMAKAKNLAEFREFVFNMPERDTTPKEFRNPEIDQMLAQLDKIAETKDKKICGFNTKITGGEDQECTKEVKKCKQHAKWLEVLRKHYQFEADLYQQLETKKLLEENERARNLANSQAIMSVFPVRRG